MPPTNSNKPAAIHPRPLSPGVSVTSFPTPRAEDLLVVMDVDSRAADYSPLDYGTAHPDSVNFPNLKLVYQAPLDNEQNYQWIRRVYAADRPDQEVYNYAIKFSGEDPSKPIYIRTYVLPRSSYSPIAKGTADPSIEGAVLVEEEVQRLKDDQDDGQLDSAYIRVIRTYETLPGPGLTTTVKGSLQAIPPKFQAAHNVVQTTTTVAPNTSPDALSTTTIESTVKQVSVAKAEKTTATIDDTTVNLSGSKLTPQQQVATVTETLVDTGSGGDTYTPSALVLEASSENFGNGKSVLSVTQVSSVFSEQSYEAEKSTWAVPHKFKAAVPPIKSSEVVAGTVSTSDVTLAEHDMSATSEQITEFKKKISKTSMASGRVDLTGTRTGMWGVETTVDSLTDSVGTASGAYKKKDHIVEPLGDGRANETKINYPSSPATLHEPHMDETYRILVNVEKTLVDPSSGLPSLGGHAVVERHPIDAWNSIQIVSTLDTTTLPEPETWKHALHYSFPDELIEVGVVYEATTSGDAKAGGTNPATGALSGRSWRTDASVQAGAVIRAVPYTLVKSGYSGVCKAHTVRTFYTDPSSIPDVTPTAIQPVMGAIIITGVGGRLSDEVSVTGEDSTWIFSSVGSGRSTDLVAVKHTFGPHVHGGLSLTETPSGGMTSDGSGGWALDSGVVTASGGGVSAGLCDASAEMVASIKATLKLPTSSTPIASGTSIVVDARVEKWRFGVWIQEVTYVTRP